MCSSSHLRQGLRRPPREGGLPVLQLRDARPHGLIWRAQDLEYLEELRYLQTRNTQV